MVSPALVPDPACLHLLSLEAKGQTILMDVVSRAIATRCPLCQCPSERIHSRYRRWVADLPWANLAVQVCLHVRRFFCDNPACCRRIFTERLPTIVVPYGRKTLRLMELLTAIGFALGGEAGQRMSQQVGCSTSGDALLHQIRVTPSPAFVTPRVLG